MSFDLEERIATHLRVLAEEIGSRPIGTPANHAAGNYIAGVMRAAGLAVEEQSYPCPAWEDGGARLELDGRRLAAWTNAFSAPCAAEDTVVAAATLAELRQLDPAGRIVLLHGDLTAAPLSPKGCTAYHPEHDRELIRLLEERPPAAAITVSPEVGGRSRLIEDWTLAVPSATVPAEVGLVLLGSPDRAVRLRIASRSAPSYTFNLVGTRGGWRPERVVLCAHYDTKFDTPGAWDNASGTAALLALAEMLGSREGPIGLEFVAFTGEEYGADCDGEYLRRREPTFATALCVGNFDGIGLATGVDTITTLAASPAFTARCREVAARHPSVVGTDPWPQSNHSTFARRGVPAVAFTSRGVTNLAHRPGDTVEWVSPGKVAEVARLAAELVESLGDATIVWTRPPDEAA